MDKQKQIEEMVITAYPIYATMEDSLRKEAIECMNSYTVFERLYNAGYRKIPENAVAMTREKYDKLRILSEECLDWRRKYCNVGELPEEKQNLLQEMYYERGKFDGVVKFVQRLKAECYDGGVDDKWVAVSFSRLDEIAKKITEGKECQNK